MKTLSVIGGVIALVAVTLFISKAPEAEHFQTQLHDDILEGAALQLSDYTNFEWDRVVIVSPYHNTTSAWDKIGYVWLGYLLTPRYGVDEAWYHWIFTKDGTVVAYAPVHHVPRMDSGEDYVLPHSLPDAPVFDGSEFTPNDVLELQVWEHESHPFCRHQLVASGTVPEYVGVRRFDSLECSPQLKARQNERNRQREAYATLEKRWHQYREHLPEDVQVNLDRVLYGLDFERLAKVVRIEERTWCDTIAFTVPRGEEPPPNSEIVAIEADLKRKCLSVAEKHPRLARIVANS